jgi:hypothetical protein
MQRSGQAHQVMRLELAHLHQLLIRDSSRQPELGPQAAS